MQEQTAQTVSRILGREPELALLTDFLSQAGAHRAFLVTGEAGIGKTTIWEAGISDARERGFRILSARPSDVETQLSFTALADLLDEVGADALAGIPPPQRRALEVALLRAEPRDAPPDQRAIALGFLNALRQLAEQQPLLVAIDDVQWLDRASAHALTFAIRRLSGVQARFLLAKRSGTSSSLVDVFEPGEVRQLEINSLSSGALRRLLFERLDLSLTRRVLRQVTESAQGNPLLALELGRAIAEHGPPAFGAELSVPERLEDILGARVSKLRSPVRKALMAVALCSTLRIEELEAVADVAAIQEAADNGLLVIEGDSARAAHPLLAAAAMRHSRVHERREVPLALAGAIVGEQLRATLLAVATTRPDAALSATIAAAAADAARRGAGNQAVYLAEHALRLIPAGSTERYERLLALAQYLTVVGDEDNRVVDLLAPELASWAPGTAKARAFMQLAHTAPSYDEIKHYQTMALVESEPDPGLHATVVAAMCEYEMVIRLQQIGDAERRMDEALANIHEVDPHARRLALHTLAWARSLRGASIDDVCERFHASPADNLYVGEMPDRVAAQRHVWRGEADQARGLIARLLTHADGWGQGNAYALLRLHLCELELRLGAWAAAEDILVEWEESSDRDTVVWPMYERCRALLAAGRGLPLDAERWAALTIERTEETGMRWDLLEVLRARGIAALFVGEPERAAASLRVVWEHTVREGIDDPGAFPAAPDLVEALVDLGELDEARAVTARLRELSEQQKHPWGLATTMRCEALILLRSAPDDAARQELADAADAYGMLGLRFDRARCLLALGRAERRLKKRAAARASLEQAAAAFEEIGADGWAEQASSELDRVGARPPQPQGTLSPAEQRVVTLAIEGLANKEIAAALHVSVHTVEVHLSHAYSKLGVRSRSQLAGRLAGNS